MSIKGLENHKLLKDEKYTSSASALEDSEIYMIPKEDFFSLIYKNPEVSRKFIEMLSNNLLEKEKQLVKLAYNSVRKRVAEALVKLSDKYKGIISKEEGLKLNEHIKQMRATDLRSF